MLSKELEQHIALAGVCQSAMLVQEVARRGAPERLAYESVINSLVITDPDSTEAVYGGISNLAIGFKTIVGQLNTEPGSKDAEVTRYIASILGLERKLNRNRRAMSELGNRINQLQRQVAHADVFDSQSLQNMASIYSDVISPLAPKIQVAGNPANLNQVSVQHKVRALLLAGVRSAVLWRQLGGKRRNILFQRRNLLKGAERALHIIQQTD